MAGTENVSVIVGGKKDDGTPMTQDELRAAAKEVADRDGVQVGYINDPEGRDEPWPVIRHDRPLLYFGSGKSNGQLSPDGPAV